MIYFLLLVILVGVFYTAFTIHDRIDELETHLQKLLDKGMKG